MFASKMYFVLSWGLTLAARAYLITAPSDLTTSGAGWSTTGPNIIAWQRVSTDPDTFSMVLVNEDRSLLPVNNQFLATSVDGTILSIAVSPASGEAFPAGFGFRVNFIKDSDVNTIYAQSNQFRIAPGGQGTGNPGVTSMSASNTSSAIGNGGSSSTQTQMPRTTYLAPAQTQTVTTTIGSANVNSTPDKALAVLLCGMGVMVWFVWGDFL